MASTRSGRVSVRRSFAPSLPPKSVALRSNPWIWVPMAPSKTRTRFSTASRNVTIAPHPLERKADNYGLSPVRARGERALFHVGCAAMRGARGDMRTVWAIALGVAVLRVLLFHGLDLYADEAYYWMWSRRPALGYFDHPPLVAWLVRAGTALLPGELGVRILFVACGALAVVFSGLIARELTDDPRAPPVAAALAATSPMLLLTGGLALPDAPVEAAYAAATWLVARARGRGWIVAGVAVGLALLSKYTAALLAPALFLLVVLDRELRRELRTPWPWLGGAVAVLVFLPNLAWNATHDWVAIGFQVRHGGAASGATLRSIAEFVGGLVGGAGVVAFPLGLWRLLRGRDSASLRIAVATLAPV